MVDAPHQAPPALPPAFVPRPRLRAALDGADGGAGPAALTVVSAGPGTGKTTLLADWAGDRDDLALWWSAAADDTGARFWPAFLRAVRHPDRPPPVAWSPGVAADLLVAALDGAPAPARPAVVVLDDAHLLAGPDLLDGLDLVVRRWPDRVRLVLGARHDPLLPLHRYRIAGQLREVRAADLAMTRPEAVALLRAHRAPLPDAQVDALLHRTEGWVGGLATAAAALGAGADPDTLLDGLAATDGGIAEYLVTEVLAHRSPRERALLLATSLLGEVDAALAAAVTDGPGPEDLLADLARTGPFVAAVDPAFTRFRYAPLFRDVLASIARAESPNGADRVFARAATWLAANGDPVGALRWAVRESTPAHAHRLLVRGGLARAVADGVDLGQEIGGPLPRARPGAGEGDDGEAAQRVLAWALAAAGPTEPAGARACLDEVLARPAERSDPALALTAYVAEVLLAHRCVDGPALDRAVRRLSMESWLARLVRAVPGLAPRLRLLHARSRFATGHPEDVEPLLLDALEHAEHDGDPPAARLAVLATLALASASATRPVRSATAVAQAEALLAADPDLTRPVALDVAIARNAYMGADLARMRGAVDRMLAAGPVYADHSTAASVAFLHATLRAAAGDPRGAEELLRGSAALHDRRAGLLRVYGSCELAAVLTAQGRPREALQVLAALAGTPFEICGAVEAARAHLALGESDTARGLVRRVRTEPSPLVTRLTLVEALVCEALIDLRADAEGAALAALQQALDLAGGEVVVPFTRALDDLTPLIEHYPVLAARWPAALPAPTGGDDAPRPPAALTPREVDVLHLLMAGSSAAAIADALAVSVTTVKTHLAGVYRKLGVAGRRDAVRRARELGMG